ncbi:MAG TPA: protein kinase, partial [Chroococcales cyanobacterium]
MTLEHSDYHQHNETQSSTTGEGSGQFRAFADGGGLGADAFNCAAGTILARRYEMTEKIGAGGMAVLYRGRDRVLGRDVAVKILDRKFADEKLIRRFHNEARAASKLQHKNLVTVFDFGQDGGQPYLIMDYIEGESLSQFMRRCGQLDEQTACEIVLQILSGLAHAHRNNVVHRDIKPANIMITIDSSDEVVVKI